MIPFIVHINDLEFDQISFFLYCLKEYANINIVIANDGICDFFKDKFVFINKVDVYKIKHSIIMTFPKSFDETFCSYQSNTKILYVNTIPCLYSVNRNKKYIFNKMINDPRIDNIIVPTINGAYGVLPYTDVINEFEYDKWASFIGNFKDKENYK